MRNIFFSCFILLIFTCGMSAQEEVGSNYVIGEEDIISVIVRNEPEFSTSDRMVRMDGMITMPMLGEIYIIGKTARQLEEEITEKLKMFVVDPIVIVVIEKVLSHRVTIAGNIAKMGHYAIGTPSTVLDIIIRAGGPTPTAKVKNIKIVRVINGREVQFSFNYRDVIRGKNLRQNILLENRDLILVP